MGLLRQIASLLIGLFVFFAIITALSRLLVMKDFPDYIANSTKGLSNLFAGAFAIAPIETSAERADRRRNTSKHGS